MVRMLIIGCVCSLWQILVNDLKDSPGGPRYDCTCNLVEAFSSCLVSFGFGEADF